MRDYGGVGHKSNPPHPHTPQNSPSPSPPPPDHWPADFPYWLSSLSPQPPSSPQEHLPTPTPGTPPRSPLPVTRPPTPVPHPQTPLPPLAQRRQARNPPAADWKENQYKVRDAEQFRDKPKRTRQATPSEPGPSTLHPSPSPQPSAPAPYPPFQPSWPSPLPPQLSTPPAEIHLSPPPGNFPSLPSPGIGPSSSPLWQHRSPTPAISSDEDEDDHSPAQVSPEDD